ncbi:3'-5' exonuclease family protein [Agromyces humi]|uniref:hypothetical protein n=1 Tax=Agromyces humi TaxID=1766800 RepID=UPI0013585635|nr:hypothetical protein [Agromyces humi]
MTDPAPRLHYVFLDLECTGLTDVDDIIEFGLIGTTVDLQVMFEQQLLVEASDRAWQHMLDTPIVRDMHTTNGLIDELVAARAAGTLPSVADAEQQIITRLKSQRRRDGGPLILAGSGVWHSDMHVLERRTPKLRRLFADRRIFSTDVFRHVSLETTGEPIIPLSGSNHRALDDARHALEEAREIRRIFAGRA